MAVLSCTCQLGVVRTDLDTVSWECNECGAQEFTGSLSETDLQYLACTSCGGNEFHEVTGCSHTYVDVDLHRYKCSKCGKLGYYSESARKHYEEGIKSPYIDEPVQMGASSK